MNQQLLRARWNVETTKGKLLFAFSSFRLFAPVSYLLALFGLIGLPSAIQAQIFQFKPYTTAIGMPSNIIFSLYQDHKGYLWIGTDSGVCRYDGVNYTTFSVSQGLINASVREISEDSAGNLWVATVGGLSCLRGTRFTNYTTAHGLSSNEVYSVLRAHDGTMWFGTSKGLSHFDGHQFTNFGVAEGLPPSRVWTLLEDQQGYVWLGMRGGGLAKLEGNHFKLYGQAEGLPDANVFDLAQGATGGLWCATSGGLSFFDGTKFHTYTTADGLGNNLTGSVIIDQHQRVWCGTFGGGLCRLEQDGHFTVFNRNNGLTDNYLTTILQDREGNIWCGTRLSGLLKFSNEEFTGYTPMIGIGGGTVTGIGETSDGTVWFSAISGGLSALDPHGKTRRYSVKDGLLDEGLWSLFIDSKERVWVGSYTGVTCFDGHQFQQFKREQLGLRDRITAIAEDRQGNMWFATYTATDSGIVKYDGHQFTRYTTANGLPSNQIISFQIDHNGIIWMASDGGLIRFDGNQFRTFHMTDGLPSEQLRCLYEDEQGTLWIGTDNGLCRFDQQRFQSYTITDGLPSNVIRAVTSSYGLIWVGTPRGISVFNGKTFHTYTTKDGLISEDIAIRACMRQSNGNVWFGSNEGAIRYCSAPKIVQELPPNVYVNQVLLFDQPLEWPTAPSGQYEAVVSLPTLTYTQNSLTFEFVGLAFEDEKSIRYRFQLEGFDRIWSPETIQRSARFTNLPPGSYRFQVKARSASGIWSPPRVVELTIRPPYWQTWWFRLLGLSIVVASGYGIFTWRIQILKQRQQQRVEQLRQIQENRLESLRQLLESIRVINSQLDLTTVLQSIAIQSARLIDGEPGGIGLIEGNHVVFNRLWLDGTWTDCSFQFPLGEGIAGKVAATAKAMIVNESGTTIDNSFPEKLAPYYVYGYMDIPIITRTGKVVGVLDVRRSPSRGPFTESDAQLIESLAHQAAVAIENAALYGEMEKLYQNEQQVTHMLQQLNQMKTNFMIVTSHEMRTPLTVLKAYSEAMLEGYLGSLTQLQHDSIASCARMVDRMVRSFEGILEMLKINEGRIALNIVSFDLSSMIREIALDDLGKFIERRQQHITCDIPEELLISADQEKIALVLMNLIQNAIKFTYDKGEIDIRLMAEDETAHILVSDTGIGIEPNEIEHIFEKFYTSPDPSTHRSGQFEFSARGTGLGLAIAKGYVEAHGGRIWAESAGKGQGSCFHIVLPFETKTNEIDIVSQSEVASS